MTPAKAYINSSGDTCFCWCGKQLVAITEFKVKAEGADSLIILEKNSWKSCRKASAQQAKEIVELRTAGKLREHDVEVLEHAVKVEKRKTKATIIISVLLIIGALFI